MQYADPRDTRFDNWNSKSGYYDDERVLTAGLARTDSERNLQDTSKFVHISRTIAIKQYNQNKSKLLQKEAP